MAKSRPLPQWPAGRKTITINEIAEMVLEFQFPSAPMAEEYNSDLQAAAFEKLINEPGRIDDTFEDHDQRRLARQAIFEKEHEKGVRATVEGTVREEQIRLMVTWLLSIAHSSHVQLFDWISGNIPDMEPHGGSRVYESGFQKIIIVVLDHIKEADAESPAESAPVEVEVAAIATVPESEEVLTGTRLDKALYRYVEDTWGPDYKQLPGRERLLPHLRQKFPKCTVTDGHARAIRRKYAPHALKKGGAPLHRT